MYNQKWCSTNDQQQVARDFIYIISAETVVVSATE